MPLVKPLKIANGRIRPFRDDDTIDPTVLGTGERNGTKFLRDDGTWTDGGSGGYDGNPQTIQQNSNYRFVTDTEKSTWNGKAEGNHNHSGVYSPVGHNHDGTYAPANHNHDSTYEKKRPINYSTADQTINAASSALLTGSVITIPPGKIQIGSIFKFKICLSKTAAGTAANTFIVRLGTAGTIADAAILTFTLPVGTAVADTGEIDITITIRGPIANANTCIAQGALSLVHNLASTGLATVPAVCLRVTSAGFNPTTDNLKMSVSCTTAASTVLTFQQLIAEANNI